jgi:retron-type reverse transcriptase
MTVVISSLYYSAVSAGNFGRGEQIMDLVELYKKKINNNVEIDDCKKNFYIDLIDRLNRMDLPIIFNSYHFSNILGINWELFKEIITEPEKFYHHFSISKKNSTKKRNINSPNQTLDNIHRFIKNNILDKIKISSSAHGFIKGKSILTNAKTHLNQEIILNMDLENFFPSISSNRVFNIFKNICGYDDDMSHCLSKLVMYHNGLPQGACTSPVISNIVCYKLDYRLENFAKIYNIKYTRYADDLTFSGSYRFLNVYFKNFVEKIIVDEGFNINHSKSRFNGKSRRQIITGLVINNNNISIPKEYIRRIRQELFYIDKYGYELHKSHENIMNKFYKDHLLGKIGFVMSINKLQGIKLFDAYNKIKWDET